MKPYLIYNEYGSIFINHPSIPYGLGIPSKDYFKKEDVEEIVKAMLISGLCDEDMDQLKRDLSVLILKVWGNSDLPELRIIKQ